MELLAEITNSNNHFKLMTCKETAELLRVDIKTLYAWLSRKQLPVDIYRKIGRKPVFIYNKVVEWFYAGAPIKKR